MEPASPQREVTGEVSVCNLDQFQAMLDSLKSDICSKIYSSATDLGTEISSVRDELRQAICSHNQVIAELEHASTDHSYMLTTLHSESSNTIADR